MDSDTLAAINHQVAEYRQRYKMNDSARIEVTIPHHQAEAEIRRWGSLEEASDALFRPGSVRLVDVYWRDFCWNVQERVNARLQSRS